MLDKLRALRQQAPIIPGHFHSRARALGRKFEMNLGGNGKGFEVSAPARGTGGDFTGQIQIQRPIGVIDNVSTHVANHAAAKIHPAAPVKGMIGLLYIRPVSGGP